MKSINFRFLNGLVCYGNLLIDNDPYQGVRVEKGKLVLPDGPGLGVKDC